MVAPIRSYAALGRSAQTRRSAGPGFALPEAEASQEARPMAGIQAGFGLIGLQQGWSEAERDEAAARRGAAVLEELARLQLSMLAGSIDMSAMSRLAHLAEGEPGADPVLQEIIEGISLRARIELARVTVSDRRQSGEIATGPCTCQE